MQVLLGFLAFAILTLCCSVWLRRAAQERDPWLLALASLALAPLLLVLGSALLLPWLPPVPTLIVIVSLAAAGAWLGCRTADWPALLPGRPGGLLTLLCLPGAVLCATFALFIMSVCMGVDDGFFLHSSNMGQILAGQFPPTNFLGEPLQGHYGKDILTAMLALQFGISFLDMEWISTVAIQVIHFLFLAHWLRIEGGHLAHGLLGAHFAFLGSAFGSHLGLIDTLDNNNAVAYVTLSVASYLMLRWWRNGRLSAALLAGLVLGLDALIYELHFGLLGLTLFTFTLAHPSRYRGFLVLVGSALLLASVEGGAITHLARKALIGRTVYQQDAKKAWQNQNVEITIPKALPFHLRRDNLRPSRFFETKWRPFGASFAHSRETTPIWSAPILTVFWYPVWLAPLTLLALIRQRNLVGGWFFALAFYSVLTPCLVSFGYFDGESARWLFGAAVGFCTAFALALAQALQRPGRVRSVAGVILGLAVIFHFPALKLELGEMRAALAAPGQPLPDGSPGIVPGGGLLPNPEASLAHHYGFETQDWAVVSHLRERSASVPDLQLARYLFNYPDERVAQGIEVAAGGIANVIGLQTSLSGRIPAGLSGAPENLWCPPLFSPSLRARAFWADPAPWRLRELQARWVMVQESRLDPQCQRALESLPGLALVAREGDRVLWELDVTAAEEPVTSTLSELRAQPPAEWSPAPRQPYLLPCLARATEAGVAALELRYLHADSNLVANPDDLLPMRWWVGTSLEEQTLPLVGPFFPGRYRLEWRPVGQTAWRPLTELEFSEQP